MPADPAVRNAIGCRKIFRALAWVLFVAGLALMFGLIASAYHAGVWE